MQAVRQFRSFCLDKWVIECSAVELFEAMDCIFEVCYNLKERKYLAKIKKRQLFEDLMCLPKIKFHG